MDWKQDERPAKNGWAPGRYVARCSGCGDGFTGAKHSARCADCAYAMPEPPTPLKAPPIPLSPEQAIREILALFEGEPTGKPADPLFELYLRANQTLAQVQRIARAAHF